MSNRDKPMSKDEREITADSGEYYGEKWTVGMRDKPYVGVSFEYYKSFRPKNKKAEVEDVISTLQSRYNDIKNNNRCPNPSDFPVATKQGGGGGGGDRPDEFFMYNGRKQKVYNQGKVKGIYINRKFTALSELDKPKEKSEGNWDGGLKKQGVEL